MIRAAEVCDSAGDRGRRKDLAVRLKFPLQRGKGGRGGIVDTGVSGSAAEHDGLQGRQRQGQQDNSEGSRDRRHGALARKWTASNKWNGAREFTPGKSSASGIGDAKMGRAKRAN